MIHFMKNSRVGANETLLPFQFGVILYSKSLKKLYTDLSTRGIKHIFTRKLHQEEMEHLFGMIRQMGAGYTHISPLVFKHRLKLFVLSRKNVLVSVNPNSKFADDVPCRVKNLITLKSFSCPIKHYHSINDNMHEYKETLT